MAFYVSIREGVGRHRTTLAAGPFRRHGDAVRQVDRVRRVCDAKWPTDAAWFHFGTARLRRAPRPIGKLNAALGLRFDDDGYLEVPA